MAQLDIGPAKAVFERSEELVNHMKPLYLRGHIDGAPVSHMLVDGGAAVNLVQEVG